ncbi:MAG: cytochrome c family protein [Alphaproteobacteria bacterium]|nr:cytochrome c family protein [Alphaproteobacteria bacterium]
MTGNKILAGVICALLMIKLGDFLARALVSPDKLDAQAYIIDVPTDDQPLAAQGPSGPTDIQPLLASASIENGEKIFKRCIQCHTPNKGGSHKIGPNLWNIFMHDFASQDGYSYSRALSALKGQKKWTIDSLNHFLYKPSQYVPGTKMSFVGLKNDQERADVIAYLNSLSDQPQKLS